MKLKSITKNFKFVRDDALFEMLCICCTCVVFVCMNVHDDSRNYAVFDFLYSCFFTFTLNYGFKTFLTCNGSYVQPLISTVGSFQSYKIKPVQYSHLSLSVILIFSLILIILIKHPVPVHSSCFACTSFLVHSPHF